MKISEQLSTVMRAIWEGNKPTEPVTTPIKAMVSYVKNHGNRNVENVFEVLDILWGENVRGIKQRTDDTIGHPGEYYVDVSFDDDSQVLLTCTNGIANAIEVVS